MSGHPFLTAVVLAMTLIAAGTLTFRNRDLIRSGFRWWLRRGIMLLVRVPALAIGIYCTAWGAALEFDLNARALIAVDHGAAFVRWWLLFIAPLVLSITALPFVVPLLSFFGAIPRAFIKWDLSRWKRLGLSVLIVVGVPLLLTVLADWLYRD